MRLPPFKLRLRLPKPAVVELELLRIMDSLPGGEPEVPVEDISTKGTYFIKLEPLSELATKVGNNVPPPYPRFQHSIQTLRPTPEP